MAKICKVDFKRHKYKDVTLTSCTIPEEINLIEDEETDYILRSGDIICIIVGGTMFQIRKSKFAFWPKTRVSKLIRAKTKEEMVTLCDSRVRDRLFLQRRWPRLRMVYVLLFHMFKRSESEQFQQL